MHAALQVHEILDLHDFSMKPARHASTNSDQENKAGAMSAQVTVHTNFTLSFHTLQERHA
jgi:hypothetical protein